LNVGAKLVNGFPYWSTPATVRVVVEFTFSDVVPTERLMLVRAGGTVTIWSDAIGLVTPSAEAVMVSVPTLMPVSVLPLSVANEPLGVNVNLGTANGLPYWSKPCTVYDCDFPTCTLAAIGEIVMLVRVGDLGLGSGVGEVPIEAQPDIVTISRAQARNDKKLRSVGLNGHLQPSNWSFSCFLVGRYGSVGLYRPVLYGLDVEAAGGANRGGGTERLGGFEKAALEECASSDAKDPMP
jgi:hypothetical protein